MRLELTESDLFRFLRIILNSFCGLAEKKKINYKLKIPEDPFMTFYDQDKIEKIIYNLLSNAFKFTPEGGSVEVLVSLIKNTFPPLIEISVKDSGPGISPENVGKIFDRFYRAGIHENAEQKGSGIGLSLAKELTELMHGEIRVNSKLGEGSTFMVSFPPGFDHFRKGEYIIREWKDFNEPFLTTATAMPCESTEKEDHFPDSSEFSDKPHILVVDDDMEVRNHIIENIGENFIWMEAGTGTVGLNKAIETIPDIIIADLIMPEMDGMEMCRRLRTDQRTCHIPVIMLTAKTSLTNKIKRYETGADEYITKPFNIHELNARIRNLIEQRKVLREQFGKDIRLQPQNIPVTSYNEKFLARLMEIIEDNINNCDFDVRCLTTKMNISRVQLFRKLKALTGQSPSEFIRTIRLKRAAQLLEHGYGNIAEVTYQVGFNNLSYFARCFRELYGVTPSVYSRQRSFGE